MSNASSDLILFLLDKKYVKVECHMQMPVNMVPKQTGLKYSWIKISKTLLPPLLI